MQNEIRQDKIVGSRRFSNYFWAFFLFFGGIGFLLAGLSSYFKIELLAFVNTTELVFIPQGLIMMFYGTLSFGVSISIIISIVLDIGSGYNEYNNIHSRIYFEEIRKNAIKYYNKFKNNITFFMLYGIRVDDKYILKYFFSNIVDFVQFLYNDNYNILMIKYYQSQSSIFRIS